jgi:two-component system sensor histidine kinase UhpB
MNILLIDDSKEDRELISSHIDKIDKKEKIVIDECNCLTNAIEKLKQFSYDIIMLDLMLPESDGITTVKKVFNLLKDINKEIPIIILTGVEDYSLGREAWSLGVKDYLIKGEIQSKDLSRALKFASYETNSKKRSTAKH